MKEKLATYYIVNQQDGWSRFWEVLPFWVMLGLLVILGYGYCKRCFKWMEVTMGHVDKRIKVAEERIEKVEHTLSGINRWVDVVDGLVDEVDMLKASIKEKDPLKVIAGEQKDLGHPV